MTYESVLQFVFVAWGVGFSMAVCWHYVVVTIFPFKALFKHWSGPDD